MSGPRPSQPNPTTNSAFLTEEVLFLHRLEVFGERPQRMHLGERTGSPQSRFYSAGNFSTMRSSSEWPLLSSQAQHMSSHCPI